MPDGRKLILSPFWSKTREKQIPVKRRQIETVGDKDDGQNKEDGQK